MLNPGFLSLKDSRAIVAEFRENSIKINELLSRNAVNFCGAKLKKIYWRFAAFTGLIFASFLLNADGAAYATTGNDVYFVFRGAARTLFSSVEIPRTIIENPGKVPFPLNLVTGTIAGTFKTITGTLMGAVDIARGAAPYAKYLIFL